MKRLRAMLSVLAIYCLFASVPANAQDATAEAPFTTPVRVEVQAADGQTLVGDLYNAELNVQTPAVLLMHMLEGKRSDWDSLIPALTGAGYRVLNVDLRGHGESGFRRDWAAAVTDVQAWLDWMLSQPSIDPTRIGIVGASIGANLALVGCANEPACVTVVALSPGLDIHGITTSDAVENGLRRRSALIIAAWGDRPSGDDAATLLGLAHGEISAHIYDDVAHGTRLLATASIPPEIVGWLNGHLR